MNRIDILREVIIIANNERLKKCWKRKGNKRHVRVYWLNM